MSLHQLLYTSTKSSETGINDIEAILRTARNFNSKNHITGLLCFNKNYFVQILEGDRETVNLLYNRIIKDGRHTKVTLNYFKEIPERNFEQWSMGYIPGSKIIEPITLKYSGNAEFDPYNMPSESLRNMMVALKDIAPIV